MSDVEFHYFFTGTDDVNTAGQICELLLPVHVSRGYDSASHRDNLDIRRLRGDDDDFALGGIDAGRLGFDSFGADHLVIVDNDTINRGRAFQSTTGFDMQRTFVSSRTVVG